MSATGEKATGNTRRVTHTINDVRLINEIFTSLDRGGKKAEKKLGGRRCGGEESLMHFKNTLGWVLERDAYVIDWETYTCIFPARMTGTSTQFTKKERDAQRTFYKRMKESSSSSSGKPVIVKLCAKPPPEIIEKRLRHVLQPKPKSSEDARRDALFANGGWIKKMATGNSKTNMNMYFHEPSGWTCQYIKRAENFQAFYDQIIDLKWTVKPHETEKKPVYIPPENKNKNKRGKKKSLHMAHVTQYLARHGVIK